MADINHEHSHTSNGFKIDKVWATILLIPAIIAWFDPALALDTIRFVGKAMKATGVFIAFAVLAVAYMKATGAESLLAKAFEGRETRMILFAAVLGGLSPFCSSEDSRGCKAANNKATKQT